MVALTSLSQSTSSLNYARASFDGRRAALRISRRIDVQCKEATSQSQFSPSAKSPYRKNVRLSPRSTYSVKIFEYAYTTAIVPTQTDKYESPSCYFFSFLIRGHRSRGQVITRRCAGAANVHEHTYVAPSPAHTHTYTHAQTRPRGNAIFYSYRAMFKDLFRRNDILAIPRKRRSYTTRNAVLISRHAVPCDISVTC